jgi:hypothetical protein
MGQTSDAGGQKAGKKILRVVLFHKNMANTLIDFDNS